MHQDLPSIIGEHPGFLDTLEHCSRLAVADRSCLVVGERGTGKELFAARLHYLSPRWSGPLLGINCAALSETLLESELFGHEAGAFTGAQRRHSGRFERAHGGTLLLDEIASASLALQEKLLRIIEYGEFERVGGSATLRVDVRLVAAANQDLPALARRGRFRADLLDRLAFDVITLPPLRARGDDVLLLAEAFALEMTRGLGRERFPGFGARARRQLQSHPWPGNVRELRNVVERAVFYAGEATPVEHLNLDPFASPWRPTTSAAASESHPDSLTGPGVSPGQATFGQSEGGSAEGRSLEGRFLEGGSSEGTFHDRVAAYEKQLLRQALEACQHHQKRTAEHLGLGYHQLRRLLQKYNL